MCVCAREKESWPRAGVEGGTNRVPIVTHARCYTLHERGPIPSRNSHLLTGEFRRHSEFSADSRGASPSPLLSSSLSRLLPRIVEFVEVNTRISRILRDGDEIITCISRSSRQLSLLRRTRLFAVSETSREILTLSRVHPRASFSLSLSL